MLKENNLALTTACIFIILTTSCGKPKTNISDNQHLMLEGIWSYIENDSVYGEIICTHDFYWTYTEGGGPRLLPYEIRNDSLKTPFLHAELQRVSKNEFLLLGDGVRVELKRLSEEIDTALLIQGNDSAIHHYYFGGFVEREKLWKKRHD